MVVATGATSMRPDLPGIDRKNVVYAGDVPEGGVEVGEKVVVVSGGAIGCKTAYSWRSKEPLPRRLQYT